MYKYKNISQNVQTLAGKGDVNPDEVIEIPFVIENPNFKFVGQGSEEPSGIVGTAAPQPNAVTEASKIDNKEGEQ